jgi:hypothetical protein
MCVTYIRVLNWWQDLLHTYTTCYYTSQTTIWLTMSSLLHQLRLLPQENPSILTTNSLLQTILHITSRHETHRKHCLPTIPLLLQGVFTSPLHINGSSIVGACTFPREPVYCRCLAMNYSDFQASCSSMFAEIIILYLFSGMFIHYIKI